MVCSPSGDGGTSSSRQEQAEPEVKQPLKAGWHRVDSTDAT